MKNRYDLRMTLIKCESTIQKLDMTRFNVVDCILKRETYNERRWLYFHLRKELLLIECKIQELETLEIKLKKAIEESA